MTKKIWILAFLLTVSFGLLNISNSLYTKKATFTIDPTIVIGYSNWAGWWPWAIAQQEELFAKHGLNVELRWYDDYSQSLADLAAGYIDGNCQTLNDTITNMTQAVKGEVAVLITDSSTGNDKIVAETGIDTVKDLEGKTVAVERGDDFLLALSLNEAGLPRKNLNILAAETGAGVEAFIAGQSNAVRAFPPYWYSALKRQGAHEIVSSSRFSELMLNLFVVTQDLVQQHPDKVQALTDTWFDVSNFMLANLDRSNEILAQRAEVEVQTMNLFKSGTKIYRLEDNVDAFFEGENVANFDSTAYAVASFLQRNLSSIEQQPDMSSLRNPQFIKAYQEHS